MTVNAAPPPLSKLATEWLAYARSVFASGSHLNQCNAPSLTSIDPILRWPGFVGPEYETAPKRLLLVGRVHNPSGWTVANGLSDLESLAKQWLGGSMSDPDFYREYGREYALRLTTWGPWQKALVHLAAAAGVDERGVSYVNVAKCWQYPGKETAMQRRCSKTFPLESLVEIVKPHGVFVLATDKWMAKVPGAQVTSVPSMNDSAPHFQIPLERLAKAKAWVRNL